MDQALGSALRIVLDNDVHDPEQLFDVIIESYEESADSTDFDTLRSEFTDRAGQRGFGSVAEELLRHAEGNGGADFFRSAKETGTATLLDELRHAAGADEVPAEDGSYDEDEWATFLQEYGPSWDGQEETWSGFVDYFLFYAEERRVSPPAKSFVEYAEGAADRAAFFADYGITVAGPAQAEPDPEVWQAFLAEFGPSWDGTEEAWDAFTPYFLFYATERGVQVFAEAFLEHAPATTPERIDYFAGYGITIAAPSDDDVLESLEALFSPEQVAEAQQQFDEMAKASDAVPDEAAEVMSEAFAQLVAEMPEAAALSREQMSQLLASIPAEQF